MVRIIKIGHLAERRRVLVEQSEAQRKSWERELAGVKSSFLAMKRGLGFVPVIGRVLRAGIPLAARLLGKAPKKSNGVGGFISRLLAGLRTALELAPLFEKARNPDASEREVR